MQHVEQEQQTKTHYLDSFYINKTGYTKPDTSIYFFTFDCDSLQNLILKEIQTRSASQAGATPQIVFKDKVLKITIPIDSIAVYQAIHSRIEKTQTHTQTTHAQPVKKQNTYFSIMNFVVSLLILALVSIKFIR
jgi:hypothetical protein